MSSPAGGRHLRMDGLLKAVPKRPDCGDYCLALFVIEGVLWGQKRTVVASKADAQRSNSAEPLGVRWNDGLGSTKLLRKLAGSFGQQGQGCQRGVRATILSPGDT